MNQHATVRNGLSFKAFLFKEKRNKKLLILSAIAIIIQFSIFKYLYPYASYIHGDSFSYLNAADNNLTINTYLIGYSKFLRLFSVYAKPDIVLVAFQYLLIQCSILFMLFTLFYFYSVGKTIQMVLLCFMVFNPLFLHLGNMVSSDGIFLALSCTWFALLIWIIHQPSNKIIIWHALILFIAFTVRYNAMIYPLLACIAFYLSKLPLWKKVYGLGLAFVLCGWFIGLTMVQYKKLTGYWQYSPFSGWQMANNGMYAYRSVDSAERKPVPKRFKALDDRIRKFYDKTRNVSIYPTEAAKASTFYMWTPSMPLMRYRDSLFKKTKDSLNEFKKWASMGPFYKDYGWFLIKKYPLHFLTDYMWPNARKYYAPPVEFLEQYNSGRSTVNDRTRKWFGYKSTKVNARLKGKVWILDFYPILTGIINVVMLFGLLYYIILKGWQTNSRFSQAVMIGGSLWLINAGFTIFASSVALRFQSFPILLTTTFVLLLVDWMAQLMRNLKQEKASSSIVDEQYSKGAIA